MSRWVRHERNERGNITDRRSATLTHGAECSSVGERSRGVANYGVSQHYRSTVARRGGGISASNVETQVEALNCEPQPETRTDARSNHGLQPTASGANGPAAAEAEALGGRRQNFNEDGRYALGALVFAVLGLTASAERSSAWGATRRAVRRRRSASVVDEKIGELRRRILARRREWRLAWRSRAVPAVWMSTLLVFWVGWTSGPLPDPRRSQPLRAECRPH